MVNVIGSIGKAIGIGKAMVIEIGKTIAMQKMVAKIVKAIPMESEK